jgi:hypothetical protein
MTNHKTKKTHKKSLPSLPFVLPNSESEMKAKRQREETKKTADKKPEKKTCRHPVEANDQ